MSDVSPGGPCRWKRNVNRGTVAKSRDSVAPTVEFDGVDLLGERATDRMNFYGHALREPLRTFDPRDNSIQCFAAEIYESSGLWFC